jgi:hypothetical protein
MPKESGTPAFAGVTAGGYSKLEKVLVPIAPRLQMIKLIFLQPNRLDNNQDS